MESQFILNEIENKHMEFENMIIEEITSFMQSEGYVKFYYDIYDYIFEEICGDDT